MIEPGGQKAYRYIVNMEYNVPIWVPTLAQVLMADG